jgi:uncharacterized protein YeaO (DUF488 family)
MTVTIRRVYEAPSRKRGDGRRVLVDRLWPRGMSKYRLEFDLWMKEIARPPTCDLRRWYGHPEERFETFRDRAPVRRSTRT